MSNGGRGGFPCSDAGACPPDHTCGSNGLCHRGPRPADGGGAGDADGPRADAPDGARADAADGPRTDAPDGPRADAPDGAGADAPRPDGPVCETGLSCTPTNACHVGFTACGDGGATICTDTGNPQSDGTECGTNMVCSNGQCSSCAADTPCDRPGQPCKLGTTVCSTGTPMCVEAGNVAAGMPCGTGMVCAAGACVACSNGGSCTPTNACHTGTLNCAGGTPVCTDSGASVTDGTGCGTDKVCRQGACNDCRVGQSCAVTGQPCRTGTTSCNTGQAICVESGNAPNGQSCGSTRSAAAAPASIAWRVRPACRPTPATAARCPAPAAPRAAPIRARPSPTAPAVAPTRFAAPASASTARRAPRARRWARPAAWVDQLLVGDVGLHGDGQRAQRELVRHRPCVQQRSVRRMRRWFVVHADGGPLSRRVADLHRRHAGLHGYLGAGRERIALWRQPGL